MLFDCNSVEKNLDPKDGVGGGFLRNYSLKLLDIILFILFLLIDISPTLNDWFEFYF